jgi:type IV pilus assembly protein PilO
VRRFTAMPIGNKGYVTEVPFQIDIDGPYYSVVNFFDRVAKLDRIINITNLQMANTKATGPSKVKTTYSYAAGETVVASCTATTFFSHDLQPQDVAPVKK